VPVGRKAGWNSGQKSRAGRRPDPRQTEPRTGKTLGTSRGGFVTVKVASGGAAKAVLRCGERKPGGDEAHEGRGVAAGLTARRGHRTLRGEQSPEVRGGLAGAAARLQASSSNGQEGNWLGNRSKAPRGGTIP